MDVVGLADGWSMPILTNWTAAGPRVGIAGPCFWIPSSS